MLVSEILRIKGNALFTAPPHGTVLAAVTVMAQHDIGSLVVMDHGRMVGLLTFAEGLRALSGGGGRVGGAGCSVSRKCCAHCPSAMDGSGSLPSRTSVCAIRWSRRRTWT